MNFQLHFAVSECTVAGALKMIHERTLPFWWDDADNFTVVEKLAVAAFNKVKSIFVLEADPRTLIERGGVSKIYK